MVYEYKHIRQVEFADTDLAGIMHFSRFFVFMESAEHAFFRSLGYSIHGTINGIVYGYPRIKADCEYRKPLKFEDNVEIHLLVRELKERIIKYEFIFRKMTKTEPEEVARGWFTVICVTMGENGMKSVAIPKEIADQIQTAPDSIGE